MRMHLLTGASVHIYCHTDGVNVGKLASPSKRLAIAIYFCIGQYRDNDDHMMGYFIGNLCIELLRQIGE
jgi:hypothetical protein